MEQLQQCGQGPGLGLTAEGAELAVLIGQLWETSPWRPGETEDVSMSGCCRDRRRPSITHLSRWMKCLDRTPLIKVTVWL